MQKNYTTKGSTRGGHSTFSCTLVCSIVKTVNDMEDGIVLNSGTQPSQSIRKLIAVYYPVVLCQLIMIKNNENTVQKY